MPKIYGIPCEVQSPTLQRAIRVVLRQIRDQFPEDFDRIKKVVRAFRGWEKPCYGLHDRWTVIDVPSGSGWIGLFELAIQPRHTVAHELGHARTRTEELGSDYSEQASEKWAEFYATKWGFKKQSLKRALSSFSKRRDLRRKEA